MAAGRDAGRLKAAMEAHVPGVETAAVHRGQALVRPGVVPASSLLDVEVVLLEAAPGPLRAAALSRQRHSR